MDIIRTFAIHRRLRHKYIIFERLLPCALIPLLITIIVFNIEVNELPLTDRIQIFIAELEEVPFVTRLLWSDIISF